MFASQQRRRLLLSSTTRRRCSFVTSRLRQRPTVLENRGTPSTSRRIKSTTTTTTAAASNITNKKVHVDNAMFVPPPPTRTQLWRVFCHAALPMIGFGFTDQTVMIQAGNAIDCTLGVTFGLTTLTAAAFGQICSNASGVVFGGALERFANSMGLPSANLTNAQRKLPLVGRTKLAGSFLGVIFGCTLGLVNLLFIDMNQSSTLKLQTFNDEYEYEFSVEASNAIRDDATVLKVNGPDIDGILASTTSALAHHGASIVEIHATHDEDYLKKSNTNNDDSNTQQVIHDVFHVVKSATGEPFGDDELEDLAGELLEATKNPMNATNVKATINELEITNSYLLARVKKLEKQMHEKQVTIVSKSGEEHHPAPPTPEDVMRRRTTVQDRRA